MPLLILYNIFKYRDCLTFHDFGCLSLSNWHRVFVYNLAALLTANHNESCKSNKLSKLSKLLQIVANGVRRASDRLDQLKSTGVRDPSEIAAANGR